MEKKEKEEMVRWLRDRDACMLLLGIAHLGKMAEFMNSNTSELDKSIKESTDTLVDYVLGKLDKAREEGRREVLEDMRKMWDNDNLGDAPKYGSAGAGLMKRWIRDDINERLSKLTTK